MVRRVAGTGDLHSRQGPENGIGSCLGEVPLRDTGGPLFSNKNLGDQMLVIIDILHVQNTLTFRSCQKQR